MTADSIRFLHAMGWHECLGLWFTPEESHGYSLDAAWHVALCCLVAAAAMV